MSDVFDELKNIDGRGPSRPLPAAEVRRRGDRMRRRRTALQALGAAAAVAVIASGGALVSGGLTGTAPPPGPSTQLPGPQPSTDSDSPAPAPEGGWVTTIPDGFALDDGMPEPGSDAGQRGTTEELGTDWSFNPCREAVPGEASRTDFLSVTQTPIVERYQRQLAVYPGPAQAQEVVDGFRRAMTTCTRAPQGEGTGEEPWGEYATDVAGDDSFSVVAFSEQDGLRVTPATHFTVVRVGNAVLLSTYDGEFGAAPPEQVRGTARRHQEFAVAIADRMCVFAADPCVAEQPEASPIDGALLGLAELEDLTFDLATDWKQIEDREDPTLDCQADWLASLAADGMVYREFAGTGASGVVNAEAATAMLDFADEDGARAAFETVSGWIADCENRLEGTRPVSIAHDVVPGQSSLGPSLWRVVESPAPEICTECDTGWIDAQGVARIGDRVVLLSIAYTGDMMTGADTASSPMAKGIVRVAVLAATEAQPLVPARRTIGPAGLDGLELGMHTWEAPAASLVDVLPGGGGACETFRIKALERTDGVDGFAGENLGIMALFARDGMTTPEGVGIGSSMEEVRAALPGGEDLVPGYRVDVPGYPDRYYQFGFDEKDRVESLVLALQQQSCFG